MALFRNIELVVFDFDGVFSDTKFYFGDERQPMKTYSGRDSFGLKKLLELGIKVGIITNDESVSIEGVEHIRGRIHFLSASCSQNKLEVLTAWKKQLGLSWNQVAYMGDDEPDMECVKHVGFSGCPSDAIQQIRATATFVSSKTGGHGAVRDFCEQIMSGRRETRACICIPARLKSSRLPSKLLLKIEGIPIIRRTCLRCKLTGMEVFVFTDSEDIANAVSDLTTVIMTAGEYKNGTERLSKNIHHVPDHFNTVINVQGDEPFVEPENIKHALALHEKRTHKTFYTTLHEACDPEMALSSARVKVAISDNRAQWYSRSLIPFNREGSPNFHTFTGIYVFDRVMLSKFSSMPNTPCQLSESIEQLKILEHGYHIASYPTLVQSTISVDTYEDYLTLAGTSHDVGQAKQTTRLLDCTLRDGGYINNWMFDDEFVSKFLPLIGNIVDVIEVGFINTPQTYRACPVGKYRNLTRSHLASLRRLTPCKIAVMADLNALNRDAIFPYNEDVDMVRIAFSKPDVESAKDLAKELVLEGYEVCLNFMSSHLYEPRELVAHAAEVPDVIPYVVDSLGCMTSCEVKSYTSVLPKKCGIHLHNNLQQAMGTYSSICCGIVDASVLGMGRGAGNLPLELCNISTDERLRILQFSDVHMSNIPRTWGYMPEFVLQATLKCHPNFVVKMTDMGLHRQFIYKVLSELKGVAKFELSTLYEVFRRLEEANDAE